MKYMFFFICFWVSGSSLSQNSETDAVQSTIEQFFEGFHKQDSTLILATVSEDIKMQSIGRNRDGQTVLSTSAFKEFLNSILSIPKDKDFKEVILDYTIQIDGAMAHVWTPYQFWYDHNFSHCGVNSFQLFKTDDKWKIIYIVDTRRRDCKQE